MSILEEFFGESIENNQNNDFLINNDIYINMGSDTESVKVKKVFDHVNAINKKTDDDYWNNITDKDKATFNPFMVNRILSMNKDFIEIINYLQKYTIGHLRHDLVFKLYYNIIPYNNIFSNYVKGKSIPISDEVINIISKHFELSKAEAIDYVYVMGKKKIKELLSDYGISDNDAKKIMKETKI